jgi:NTP pyrophosphatase (non-canonical NTP hydrolase)
MTLDDMQNQVDTWIRDHGGYWDRFQILARLTEELGEVAGALQRTHGLRPRKTEVDLASEVGDLLFTLAAFANANDLRLSVCIESVLHKYTNRDGQAWKDNNQNET